MTKNQANLMPNWNFKFSKQFFRNYFGNDPLIKQTLKCMKIDHTASAGKDSLKLHHFGKVSKTEGSNFCQAMVTLNAFKCSI